MYLRLAFAVAAHLEPEILLVDEVLAVGDAAVPAEVPRQDAGRRAAGPHRPLRLAQHAGDHAPVSARDPARRTARSRQDGLSHDVVAAYLNSGLGTTAMRQWADDAKAPGTPEVRLRAVRVRTEDGRIAEAVDIRENVHIELEYDVLQPGHVLMPHFTLHNAEGTFVFVAFEQSKEWRGRIRPPGRYVTTGLIPGQSALGRGSDYRRRVQNAQPRSHALLGARCRRLSRDRPPGRGNGARRFPRRHPGRHPPASALDNTI